MKVHREFVPFLILLELLFGFSSSQIDFLECGGDPVSNVTITGCPASPCTVQMGKPYNVKIQPEYINPQVDDAKVKIGILQFGAYFEQSTTCKNPCIYACPLTTKLIQPEFDINVDVSTKIVPLTSVMQVNTTYYNGARPTSGFCVQFNVIVDANDI